MLYRVRFVTFRTVAFALTDAGPDSNANAHSNTDTIPRSNASTNSSSDTGTDAFTRAYICVDGNCARCGHKECDQQR